MRINISFYLTDNSYKFVVPEMRLSAQKGKKYGLV